MHKSRAALNVGWSFLLERIYTPDDSNSIAKPRLAIVLEYAKPKNMKTNLFSNSKDSLYI